MQYIGRTGRADSRNNNLFDNPELIDELDEIFQSAHEQFVTSFMNTNHHI